MKKDLRGREALKGAPELVDVADSPAFTSVTVQDLRKLAELIRDYSGGSLAGISLESATAFGGTSRHRFQCAQRALRTLVGTDHPATKALFAALRNHGAANRKGSRHRDDRTREAILHGTRWTPFREIDATRTMPMNELRALDRFLAFCETDGRGTETEDFLAFVSDRESSMLLRTLRGGLEKLLTSAHPAVVAVEQARSLKEADRYQRRKPAPTCKDVARPLAYSIPRDRLPADWLRVLDTLLAGKRYRGKKLAPKTVQGMTDAACQLVRAARESGLPDEISLDTIGAYDQALEGRGVRASSRSILFASLRMLAKRLGHSDELLADLRDLVGHYEREAKGDMKVKEARLADLPDLQAIFDLANRLLDLAPGTMDRRKRTTLYVDAAALPFLSLIPLRNHDTRLLWGQHIVHIGDDDPADWGLEDKDELVSYYLDLRTSKTDSALSGPLSPILTPFLDALILRGQDERMLPDLRDAIMKARAPVFPKSNGAARNVHNLSERWRKHLGTGSIISRTRIHTLLGALGENGTRAALALCAQRSARTAKWYQAESLAGRCMLESQDMIAGLIELGAEEDGLLSRL
ncbi:hypothetical protein [Sediminimonas qiaohouensis]|uniref:hypothetical protein n=1 Tax=Sediminimonas qiaohouensis TaxID=552061 RepID=UPI00040C0892|nr:hypothetical protein [Sediminimonas qiaohouensis]